MHRQFREDLFEPDRKELAESLPYRFEVDRRQWISVVGAGVFITAAGKVAFSPNVAAARIPPSSRLHIGEDGSITVLTGKVEVGQGSRTEILQAAAEELRVAPEMLRVMLADTAITPDDGSTAGSRTTPATVPVVRRACAAAREMLVRVAAEEWNLDISQLRVEEGAVAHAGKRLVYADLARSKQLTAASDNSVPRGVPLTKTADWSVLGRTLLKTNAREIVDGTHRYPSDIVRPGMLYGAVLRPPRYGALLDSVDLTRGKELSAVVVRDGEFVGCAAKTSYEARAALEAIRRTARWRTAPHPSSEHLGAYLKRRAQRSGGGRRGPRRRESGDVEAALAAAGTIEASYEIPYVQHAPMEPRAAVAEWDQGHLTVWTGTQRPFGVREQLQQAFRLPAGRTRVVVPDTGGGFGGKHTGEVAIEAARLARAADAPVSLRWTRSEEFAWAYFRPAAAFEARAGPEWRENRRLGLRCIQSGHRRDRDTLRRPERPHTVLSLRRTPARGLLQGNRGSRQQLRSRGLHGRTCRCLRAGPARVSPCESQRRPPGRRPPGGSLPIRMDPKPAIRTESRGGDRRRLREGLVHRNMRPGSRRGRRH